MKKIINKNDKCVCHLDEQSRTVVIVRKKFKTVIQFKDDGSVKVVHSSPV